MSLACRALAAQPRSGTTSGTRATGPGLGVGELAQAFEVGDAEAVAGAEVLDPRDQPFQSHHPGAGLAGAAPPARLDRRRGERAAQSDAHRAGVSGQRRHDVLLGDLSGETKLVPRRRSGQRADDEHAGLAEHQERDPVPGDQRVALEEPPVGRQRGERFGDACLGDREPVAGIEALGERLERLGRAPRPWDRRPSCRDRAAIVLSRRGRMPAPGGGSLSRLASCSTAVIVALACSA